jgi:arylformamidase
MKLIDLSQPLYDGCPNCPVHPPVRSEIISDHHIRGWRVEKLTLANHSGSHVDAPFHKIAKGANLDQIPLEKFVGHSFIVDLRGIAPSTPITASMLQSHLKQPINDHIILLATGWGQKRSHTAEWLYNSPHLDPSGAEFLVKEKIRGIGIDHYSIGGMHDPNNPRVHEILLGANIWIVEELKFPEEAFQVTQPCMFWSLPINLKEQTGAFCRPVIVV